MSTIAKAYENAASPRPERPCQIVLMPKTGTTQKPVKTIEFTIPSTQDITKYASHVTLSDPVKETIGLTFQKALRGLERGIFKNIGPVLIIFQDPSAENTTPIRLKTTLDDLVRYASFYSGPNKRTALTLQLWNALDPGTNSALPKEWQNYIEKTGLRYNPENTSPRA